MSSRYNERLMNIDLNSTIKTLQDGGIIIYPTESVMGIGCDPFNEKAVNTLLAIKQRPMNKGLILLAADWQQLEEYIQPIDASRFEEIKNIKNTTWLFPKTDKVPAWIHGDSDKVAVRVTSLPLAKEICQAFGKPIVSTSANFSGKPPVKSVAELDQALCKLVDAIIEGETGQLSQPTSIVDVILGKTIRF